MPQLRERLLAIMTKTSIFNTAKFLDLALKITITTTITIVMILTIIMMMIIVIVIMVIMITYITGNRSPIR